MSVQVYGCNHVVIEVDDIKKAIAFFKLGEHQFLAIFEVEKLQPDRMRHFGIMVRDEQQLAEVRNKITGKYKLKLKLHDMNGALIESNDNWMNSPEKAATIASGLAPTDPHESAILRTLDAGKNYTAVLRGVNNTTGIGLVEVYDLEPTGNTHLANISGRGFVSIGDDVLIGGVIIQGDTAEQVLFRALGPSLASRGVSPVLPDPTLDLYDVNGTLIAHNDDWMNSPNKNAIIATGLAPTDPRESAILETPAAGNYTAIVRGKNNIITGNALMEAYRLGPPPPPTQMSPVRRDRRPLRQRSRRSACPTIDFWGLTRTAARRL